MEGIVGERGNGKAKINVKGMYVLSVKHREHVCAVRKGIIKYSRKFQFWNLTGIQISVQWREYYYREGKGERESEETCGKNVYITWSCSRCETQGARLHGEKMNNKEDMEMNGLTDGD